MSTSNEDIVITVREDGVPVVQRRVDALGNSFDSAQKKVDAFDRSLRTLRVALMGLFTGLGVQQIIKYADAWTEAQNRIRVFTQSAEEANAVHLALFKVIQESRQSMAPMVQLYARVAQAADNLGASQQQVIDFTEGIAKALSIQGVTSQQARGALIQLGQAMGMTKVRAQEFNSINEQAPIILQTVAKEMFGAKGSVAQLRAAMLDGKLTAMEFYKSFATALPKIREQFALVTPTVGQAMTVLENSFIRFIGQTNKATGASGILANSIILLANNFDTLGKVILSVSPLIAVAIGSQLVKAFGALRNAILLVNAAMLANPFVAAIAIIATVIATLYAFGDSIKMSADGVVTLRDYVVGGFNLIVEWVNKAVDAVMTFINWIGQITDSFDGVTFAQAFQYGFDAVLSGAKTFINTFIGVFVGAFNAILAGWDVVSTGFMNVTAKIYNAVTSIIGSMVQSILDLLNGLFAQINGAAALVGMDKVLNDQMKTTIGKTQMTVTEGGKGLGEAMADGFIEGFDQDFVGKAGKALKDSLDKAAKSASVDRMINDIVANGAPVNLNTPREQFSPPGTGDKGKKDKTAEREARRLLKDYQALRKEIDPLSDAQERYVENLTTLNKAQAAGLIPAGKYTEYVQKLGEHYRDLLDPFGAVIRKQNEENIQFIVGLQNQEAYAAAAQKVTDLKEKGVTVTQAQAEALFKQEQAQIRLNAVMSAAAGFYQNGPEQQLQAQQDKLAGLNLAMQQGVVSATQYSVALGQIAIALGQIQAQSGEFQIDSFFNGAMAGVLEGYQGLLPGLQSAFSDFFGAVTDGISTTFSKFIVEGGNLSDMLGDLSRQIVTQLIGALIKLGIQYAVNAALAATIGSTQTAVSASLAATTAAAWAPAAALVSLATFGSNAAAASAGILATSAVSKGVALAGFSSGGYTGNGGVNQVAGLVHGQEYVLNANATSAIGTNALDRLNATGDIGSLGKYTASQSSSSSTAKSSSGNGVVINIENYGTSKDFEVQQMSEDEYRIIARDEASKVVQSEAGAAVAKDFANPNSKASKGVSTHFNVTRSR